MGVGKARVLTFLFTDVAGSSALWEKHNPLTMQEVIARHERILCDVIDEYRGQVYVHTTEGLGDGVHACFDDPLDAVVAAIAIQRRIATEDWGEIGKLAVREALHTGWGLPREDDFFGPAVNRVAHLLAAGHGGQILMSREVWDRVKNRVPGEPVVDRLGTYRVKDLQEPLTVFQISAPELHRIFPQPTNPLRQPSNLSRGTTPLIGREDSIRDILILMGQEHVRLLTLKGPAGIGKTRLAKRIAEELSEHFTDGVHLVDLAAITDPTLVTSEIARVLNQKVKGLSDYLARRHILLVLETFEQLVLAAPQVAKLVESSPRLKVLVTSQQDLIVEPEHIYNVPTLKVPNENGGKDLKSLAACPSVALFVVRAQAVKSDFRLTQTNAKLVTPICRLLDGHPGAIVLAAAQLRRASLESLLRTLERNYPDALSGGSLDVPPRLQTMRNAVERSRDTLNTKEQELLSKISIFPGSFSAEAVHYVCNSSGTLQLAEVEESLRTLAQASLLQRLDYDDSHTRYRILKPIRECALEWLREGGDLLTLAQRHAEYFLSFMEGIEPTFTGPEEAASLDKVEEEHDNIRSALQWKWDQQHMAEGLRLAASTARFWYRRGYLNEGESWLRKLLEVAGAIDSYPTDVLAKAYDASGLLSLDRGDRSQAQTRLDLALGLYLETGNARGLAFTYLHLGNVARLEANLDLAAHYYRLSRGKWLELRETWGEAAVLNNLGAIERDRANLKEAAALFQRSRELWKSLGNVLEEWHAVHNLAGVEHDQGNLSEAKALCKQVTQMCKRVGDLQGLALSYSSQGYIARDERMVDAAERLYKKSLDLWMQLEARRGIAFCYINLGEVARDRRTYEKAMAWYVHALNLFRDLDDKWGLAQAYLNMGELARDKGRYGEAEERYLESLATFRGSDKKASILDCLEGLAVVAYGRGALTRAVRLCSATATIRQQRGIRLITPDEMRFKEFVYAVRASMDDDEFEQMWALGSQLSLSEAVREALEGTG